jgi:hypothetical protein
MQGEYKSLRSKSILISGGCFELLNNLKVCVTIVEF